MIKKSKTMTRPLDQLFRKDPETELEYQELADAFIEWSKKEDTLTFNSFPLSLMIPVSSFDTYPEKSEYFAKAYDIALRTIGARRERLAREGKANSQIVLATMPLYDPEYKKWLRSLKQKEQEQAGNITVVIEKFPESNVVPPKQMPM